MDKTPQEALLGCYEKIGEMSALMVEAARREDWEALDEAQEACEMLIDRLRAVAGDPTMALDADGQRRRLEIMRRILTNDAQIREIREPWLADLDSVLSGGRRGPYRLH